MNLKCRVEVVGLFLFFTIKSAAKNSSLLIKELDLKYSQKIGYKICKVECKNIGWKRNP